MKAQGQGVALFAVLLASAMSFTATVAHAQTGPEAEPGASPRNVAIVALDRGAQSGSLMETVRGLLNRSNFTAVSGDELERRLNRSVADQPRPETTAQFSGLSTAIADGVEKFFYQGDEAALERLAPIVQLGLNHPDVMARRPDLAGQIFEAGLVLIRAYKNLEETEEAARIAAALVETFPGIEATTDTVPPEIIAFLESRRDELIAKGAAIDLMVIGGETCTGYINGSPAGNEPVPVSPSTQYFVTVDCGGSASPVWTTSVEPDTTAEVPVSRKYPLDFTMSNDDYEVRKLAEDYLFMVAYWTGMERVIGVTRSASDGSDESVLVARVQRDGTATWSDGTDENAISRVLARVLPDFNPGDDVGTVGASSSSGGSSWVGWTMVAGGVAMLGGGTYGVIAAQNRANELYCAEGVNYEGRDVDCSSVERLSFSSQEDLNEAERQVTTVRVISFSALGVGAILTGWGIYKLTSGSEGSDEAAWRIEAAPLPDGGGMAGVRWTF